MSRQNSFTPANHALIPGLLYLCRMCRAGMAEGAVATRASA